MNHKKVVLTVLYNIVIKLRRRGESDIANELQKAIYYIDDKLEVEIKNDCD